MLKKAFVMFFALPATAIAATEIGYIQNTFAMLISGILVMWMAAGFAMIEAGSVRSKNASVICLKNITLFSLAGLVYYAWGYSIMYTDVSSFMGSLGNAFVGPSEAEKAGDVANIITNNTSTMTDFFFQLTFVAATASIVSGTIAERIKIHSFLLFTICLTGLIYPIVGAMTWGGGLLADLGFHDFAGSTIVHSTGGWAALVGAIIVGARTGRFDKETASEFVPSHVPMVTFGTFVLWMGWYGFNGGSLLVIDSATAATHYGNVYAVTTLGACAGAVATYLFCAITEKIVDVTIVLNGALAGLVAITAGADVLNPTTAIVVGAIGGIISAVGTGWLAKLKIDDVVGAVPVHLFSGIWGTLAVAIFGGGSYVAQLIGIVAVGTFVIITSFSAWLLIKLLVGLRATPEEEVAGLDISETGLRAYPEFHKK